MTHILVSRLEKMVRTERKITDQIIKTLIEVESQKIHLEMGYESIFAFLVGHLGYSESAAQRRSAAMRLIQKAPEVAEKLKEGSLNLTQVSELERVTRPMQAAQILEVLPKIENKNTRQTQQIIAQEFDLPVIQHEKIRAQKDESIYMQITLTKEQYELFKKASDLLSHVKPGVTHAEVITMLAQKFVKQKLGRELDKEQMTTSDVKVQDPDELNCRGQAMQSQVEESSLSTAATANIYPHFCVSS